MMDGASAARRDPDRPPRRLSAAEFGGSPSPQDVEEPPRSNTDRPSFFCGLTERRNPGQLEVHRRHMPIEPLKLPIPRKTRENRGLLSYISVESREYEDMITVLTSSYVDTASARSFSYSNPRLVNNELLEKEFVEKRREMKAEGRTEKELEESYCFLLTDTKKLPVLCEKGLCVAPSWITVLGNPTKGVYLSRYSDLLQLSLLTPGFTGEILIFKVMKGKVKSIYENMKNLLDPTPRFDSHVSKNASKVTSLSSYRAFELTQQYFYEYSFDELRQRPRQACPYAVVSFKFKGKDTPLPSMPLAPLRPNVPSQEESKDQAQFTVWSGDLVKGDRVLFQVSLRSSSPPLLPHKLPEKLDIGHVMHLDHVTKLLPSSLFSYDLYPSSREVVTSGHFCSLLEVMDRSRSSTSVTRLLRELETKKVVLVTPLSERGFLFLLSSVQMAPPAERAETWRRSLHALFVFPQTRDVTKLPLLSDAFSRVAPCVPQLSSFIPALHAALIKAKANPPPELSAGVEQQARHYLAGLQDGQVRQYPMGEYDSTLDEEGALPPADRIPRITMDSYLRCYLSTPVGYLLSVPRVRQMLDAHCVADSPTSQGPGAEPEGGGKSQKIQQLIDLVMTCKRNAENEVRNEEVKTVSLPGRKRKLEQEVAARALKFLKASQETGQQQRVPGAAPCSSPVSYSSVIGSVGLREADLSVDGSELGAKLLHLLSGLNQTASGASNKSHCEAPGAGLKESSPFDRLATKLGLPTHCDIDLRKQDELEEQTAGSVSSLEGFSPGSHSGDANSLGGGKVCGRKVQSYEVDQKEQVEIPWILVPITGLQSERYTRRERNLPQDPRFQHITTATTITSPTQPTGGSLAPSPAPSPLPSPDSSPVVSPPPLCPSPEPPPTLLPQPSLLPSTWSSSLESNRPCSLIRGSDGANEGRLVQETSEEFPGDDARRPPQIKRQETFVPVPLICTSQPRTPGRQNAPSPSAVDPGNVEVSERTVEEEEGSAPAPSNMDCMVDNHLSNFNTEMQRLLQEERIPHSFPQSPHSTSQSETCAAPTHLLPHSSLSPLSQYVSLCNPCPPVQDYVSSLHESINSMLARLHGNPAAPPRPGTDDALATSVSAFVASVRAANSGMEGEDTPQGNDDPSPQSSAPLNKQHTSRAEYPQHGPERDGEDTDNRLESEPDSSLGSAPPPTALSSLIRQLQPEVFSNLMDIMKDVKRNSIYFYLHGTEPDDQAERQIKDHLLKQGNVEQNPQHFLEQEPSHNRLLVIIKNKDIAAHVHEIPGLVSLKRHPSVVFVGIDSLDDIRNNSYNELFMSGGCVISDELILSPDAVPHDRLSTLLMFVEQNSSPENLWRWKIHCKTLKKLKEQARFKRSAASVLDVVLAYQKRQLVEVLPYHRCDMTPLLSPDLQCVTEQQARHTQHRHTVLLTERHLENVSSFADRGIVVCSSNELLTLFSRLMGRGDVRQTQPTENLQCPHGLHRRLSQDDPAPSGVPSSFREPPPFSQPGPAPPTLDTLRPSDMDCKALHMAIAQLRAERLQQLELLQEQKRQLEAQMAQSGGGSSPPPKSPQPSPDSTGRCSPTPQSGRCVVGDQEERQSATGVEPVRKGAGPTTEPCSKKHTALVTNSSEVSLPAASCTAIAAPTGGDTLRAPPPQPQPIGVRTTPTSKEPLPVTKVTGNGVTAVTHHQANNRPMSFPARPMAPFGPHVLQQGRSLLGPRPFWPGGIAHPGDGGLLWGQHHLDSCAPLLWFPFQHPAAQGGARPHGVPRGWGGWNRK